MTQEEIRKRQEEIKAAQKDLKRKLDEFTVELCKLRRECKHPNVVRGVWDGDDYCQDCGAVN